MRNYVLDTTMFPKVWVTWATTKNGDFNGRYWLNCHNGKKQNVPEPWMRYESEHDITNPSWSNPGRIGMNYHTRNNENIWLNSNSKPYMMYVKYHADIKRLEIAVVTIDTSRKEVARNWDYAGTRLFIGKDKSIIDGNGEPIRYPVFLYKGHYAYNAKDALSTILRLECRKDPIVCEFQRFLGGDTFTIGNGSSVKAEYPWKIKRWYETVQRERGTGKQQKLTDELVAMPLGDTDGLAYKYPVKAYTDGTSWGTYPLSGVVYFERVGNGWSVLRAFRRTIDDQLAEEWRMYLNDDGRNRIVSESNGNWVPSSQSRCSYSFRRYLANPAEAAEKCNRLKYVLAVANGVKEPNLVDFVVTALRFPEIEQLIKLGHSKCAHNIAQSSTPKADLKHTFGGYFNDKEKSLLRKVGMTKYQFDFYMEHHNSAQGYYNYARRALELMRKLFDGDLSALDNASFDKYFEAARAMTQSFYQKWDRYVEDLDLDFCRFFKNLVRIGSKNRAAYGLAHDTMNDYRYLNIGTQPDVDWYFDSYSDLVRIHDAVTELKRMQEAERRASWNMAERERLAKEEKKREELDEKRKAYEYEDDNFVIRLPKTLNEIVNEGSAQRICIGGYTSRHANGSTNIFFLRKKSADDTPFYAIEMSNDKNIVQIHGYCNQWLGNDPDAIPTVVRWLRKNGIKCEETILTCKARGYGATSDYVPMPVVD